jgi:mono/diheme cytochrome c family protein
MKAWIVGGAVGLATAALAAPAKKEAAAAPIPAAAQKDADQLFATLCSTCHGLAGKGDGAAAAALNPKPRTFTDAAWQASVTDAHLAKVIVEGGPSVGKSPLMPPNPQLKDKPDVVRALVAKVRGLKGK